MPHLPTARLALIVIGAFLVCAAPAAGAVRLQKVGDFDTPIYVAAAPGDYSRIYVVERAGTVRVVRNGVTLPGTFADLRSVVGEVMGERGLLSIAFPPDFQSSRLLYAYYADAAGLLHVDELRAPDGEHTDPAYRRPTIAIPHTGATNHNGGTIAFGPDGLLYLATGDGGTGQSANAQNPSSLLGKLLRIRPTPGGGHSTPADNPSGNEVWSRGLRNPFRFSFDRATGDLVIGDVGQGTTEEIDFAPASLSLGRGWNYGWPVCEGSSKLGTTAMDCPPGYEKPVLDKFQSDGWRTINAGVVVRDPSVPSLYGRFLYGDTLGGQLWSAILRRPKAIDDKSLGLTLPHVAGFGLDAAGCVYAASLEGGVYRFIENSTAVPCPKPPPGAETSSPTSPAGPSADHAAPVLRVRVPGRQRVRKRRGATGYARCGEACTVAMSGRLRIGRRSYKLRKASKPAAAHHRIKLRVRLTMRASRALRRALERRRRARVKVALRARDAAGNRSLLIRRSVRVRR